MKSNNVDVTKVCGYDKLTKKNKKLFEEFIVNFYNAWGMEARATIKPIAINFVKDIEYLGKEKEDDYDYISIAREVMAIYEDGKTNIIEKFNDADYDSTLICKKDESQYLRFEYEINNRNEWLHVLSETKWY